MVNRMMTYATRLLIGPDASSAAIKSGVLRRDLPVSVEVVGAEPLHTKGDAYTADRGTAKKDEA